MSNILAIDGGGIRGIVTANWLDTLRAQLKQPLHEKFDIVVGVSIGAVLACMVSSGLTDSTIKKPIFEGQSEHLYTDTLVAQVTAVFPSGFKWFANYVKRMFKQGLSAPKHDHKPLEQALRKFFGDMRFGELKTTTLILGYDTIKRHALVFKSDDPCHRDLPVWQVVMASAAAPTYFPAVAITLPSERVMSVIDGGVVATNPVLCGIAEAKVRGAKIDDIVAVSLGANNTARPVSLKEAQEWGRLEWAIKGFSHSPILDVLFDGPDDANNYIARQMIGDRYLRLVLPSLGVEMDDASKKSVKKLQSAAVEHMRSDAGVKWMKLVKTSL